MCESNKMLDLTKLAAKKITELKIYQYKLYKLKNKKKRKKMRKMNRASEKCGIPLNTPMYV